MPGVRSSRRAGWAAAGLGAGLLVAACGQVPNPIAGGAATSSAAAAPSPVPSGTTSSSAAQAAPLTGLPASRAAVSRPAVALVVAGAHPVGLTSADVVFEEIGSPVRYIAVFQSRQAGAVGPITATQPTDRLELSVLHPLFGYNGAAAPFFLKPLAKSGLKDLGFASHSSLYKNSSQGLTASTEAVWRAAGKADGAPPQLFGYQGGTSGNRTLAAGGVSRPGSVRVAFPGNGSQDWIFDARADRWELTGGGPRVQAANLVVQTVSYKEIGVNRRLGIVVPVAHVIGTGQAEVFSGTASGGTGGTAATGVWSKPKAADVTNYFDATGSLMAFQPGPTWVILAPRGTRVTTSGH